MLPALEYHFSKYPVKYRLASELYSHGISIRDSKLFAGKFEVSVSSVSGSMGVNRKTVYNLVSQVEGDFVLKELFSKLEPRVSLTEVAPILGYEVLVISTNSLTALRVLDYLRKKVTLVDFSFSENQLSVVYEPRLAPDEISFLSSLVKGLRIITPDVKKQEMVCDKCRVEYCPRRVKHA